MSALISETSSEMKMDRNTKLRMFESNGLKQIQSIDFFQSSSKSRKKISNFKQTKKVSGLRGSNCQDGDIGKPYIYTK